MNVSDVKTPAPLSARGAALHIAIGASAFLAVVWIASLGLGLNRIRSYAADRVYADLAVARNLLEHGVLGIGAERLPAQSDALWQFALAAFANMGVPWLAAPMLAACVLSLAGLIAVSSLVRAVSARGAWSAWACVAWGLMLPVAADAFAGISASVAGACAALGIAAHARNIGPDRTPLPLSAACWVGLSALFRIEMLAIWIALSAHALILSLLRRVPAGIAAVGVRFLNGGLVAAILMCPAIWWNTQAVSVPWPPAPDAAMTLNAVGGVEVGGAIASGFGAAMGAIFGCGLWSNALVRLFILGGIAWLVADLARGRAGASATVLLLGALVPAAFALLHPFFGASALPSIQRAIQPLWLLLAGYLAVRVAEATADLVRRKAPQLPESAIFLAAIVLVGAMPVLAGLRGQIMALREQRALRAEAHETRAALAARLGTPEAQAGGIASDEPGWLMFQRYTDVTDLSGRFHPIVLNWAGGRGVRDEQGLRDYLASRHTRAAVIWRAPRDRYGGLFACPPDADAGPAVCRFIPTAVP